MKNILRYFSVSALAALMILSACSDPSNSLFLTEGQTAGNANLRVIIDNGNNTRTLFPNPNQFTAYRIDCIHHSRDIQHTPLFPPPSYDPKI